MVFYAIHKKFSFTDLAGQMFKKSFELVLPPVNSLKKGTLLWYVSGFRNEDFPFLPLARREERDYTYRCKNPDGKA